MRSRTATREMRLARYLHQRVRRQALAVDVRLLHRVQQGMSNLDGAEAGPIPASEPGLRWFTARYRERVAPEPGAAKAVGAAPPRPRQGASHARRLTARGYQWWWRRLRHSPMGCGNLR